MSSLLFIVLLCKTNAFYHALTDSSGTSSYIARISALSPESLDLTLYHRVSYSASPVCSDCVLFNGSLKTNAIPIHENAISFYIEYNPMLETHRIYLFLDCPLSLTISIALPSHHIQYTQHLRTETLVTHPPNTDAFHCVFEQQSDEYTSNMIEYLVYHAPNHIQLFQYYVPLQSHRRNQRILTPFNTSSIPHIAYCNHQLYIAFLSTNEHDILFLDVASYHFMDHTWTTHDDLFHAIHFNGETSIESIGIHDKKPTHDIPILNILFASHSSTKYEILSWLIDTTIYSMHEYNHNMNSEPIMVNDYNIAFILSGPIHDAHEFIYYEDINHLLRHLPFTTQSSIARRRLAKTDPECQDVSANCAHIAKDCDDDIGIANMCRATCGQCEKRVFNCSDYESSANAVDICQFPKETPSFCADPDGWFEYFCPITCRHPNCTQYWITANPTPAPTLMVTTFDTTEVVRMTNRPSTAQTVSTMQDIEDETSTSHAMTTEYAISTAEDHTLSETPILHKENNMSLILILLAVLLVCILMAAVLLWICVNIVRLQRDRNCISYNAVAAMYTRTPDFYTHAGCAPSTPDYYTTKLHPQDVRRSTFQRG